MSSSSFMINEEINYLFVIFSKCLLQIEINELTTDPHTKFELLLTHICEITSHIISVYKDSIEVILWNNLLSKFDTYLNENSRLIKKISSFSFVHSIIMNMSGDLFNELYEKVARVYYFEILNKYIAN